MGLKMCGEGGWNYGEIPKNILDGIHNYVGKQRKPGHFLQAVIKNDLYEAVLRADEETIKYLRLIVRYFSHETPAPCWGSEEKMKRWLDHYGKMWMEEERGGDWD